MPSGGFQFTVEMRVNAYALGVNAYACTLCECICMHKSGQNLGKKIGQLQVASYAFTTYSALNAYAFTQ